MTAKRCEVCGGAVVGCGYVLTTLCSPGCYRVRDDRERHERDRRIVNAWEKRFNRGIPDGEGFFVPHLEDERGRYRPWYQLKHLRDLAIEYRIYERLRAVQERRRQKQEPQPKRVDLGTLGDFAVLE